MKEARDPIRQRTTNAQGIQTSLPIGEYYDSTKQPIKLLDSILTKDNFNQLVHNTGEGRLTKQQVDEFKKDIKYNIDKLRLTVKSVIVFLSYNKILPIPLSTYILSMQHEINKLRNQLPPLDSEISIEDEKIQYDTRTKT